MHEVESHGKVRALHQGRHVLGLLPPLMTVRCFAVDGLLVDTGLYDCRAAVLDFARRQGVRRCVLTHHHEDHSANAGGLVDAGIPVSASAATLARMATGFETYLYQRLAWGRAQPARVELVGEVVETEHHRFDVIPAPGHCEDQVVLHERSEGWLFSGDAFLAERVKIFRGDEDFVVTVRTLERLVELDFDALFCAHRPLVRGGRDALRRKLEHLRSVEARVRELHGRGLGIDAIASQVLGPEDWWMRGLSFGDASKRNMVRSILEGPVARPG